MNTKWPWGKPKPQPRSEPPKPAPGASQAQLKAIWEAYPDHYTVLFGDPKLPYREEFYSQEFPHIRTLVSSNKPIQELVKEVSTHKGATDGFPRVKAKTVQCQGNTKNGKRCKRKVRTIWSESEKYPIQFDNCHWHCKDE